MTKIRVGLFGFGRTGKAVAQEFLKDSQFTLAWVIRKGQIDYHKCASRLLGFEFDAGEILSVTDINENFYLQRPVDIIVDFSDAAGVYYYPEAVKAKIPIVSAISHYEKKELDLLKSYASSIPLLYSPNITLGINVLMVAAQILQKIAPHADIEIIEEHFKAKKEVSGTAKKIAIALGLDVEKHVNSIRVGEIIGRHEIIFGMSNQTIRMLHENISRNSFGEGAIFAVNHLLGKPPGLYTMETIIAEMFRQNIPVY